MGSDRKYTLSEIEKMRSLCVRLAIPFGQWWDKDQLERRAEDRLRTYMQNGTTPDELQEYSDADMKQKIASMPNTFGPDFHEYVWDESK